MVPYQASIAEVLEHFGSHAERGLLEEDVQKQLQKYGKNKITQVRRKSTLLLFIGQFTDLLTLLLIGSAILSYFLGSTRDTIILSLIVFLNASIGFFQEYKAERLLESLKSLVKPQAKVIRHGTQEEIPADELVPGDIVILEEGDGVAADIRLLESENFSTNDVVLTGESDPQPKNHTITIDKVLPVTDQNNCVFMGVTVVRGYARGIVIATGMNTEIGKIARGSQELGETTSPLQLEINDISKKLTQVAMIVGVVMFGSKFLGSNDLTDAMVFAIGVAASMVPQGLPSQISVALSLGVGRMAKNKAIVKKLSSVETLGSAKVIASDKTGTITKNEMTITHCYFDGEAFTVTGTGYAPDGQIVDSRGEVYTKENLENRKVFFLDGYLASTGRVNPPDMNHTSWYPMGDPTESAFATLALKTGLNLEELDRAYPKVHLLGFDSVRKRMTIIREHKGKNIAFMKGGIESVLSVCSQIIEKDTVRNIHKADIDKFLELAKVYASQAYRVLAVAYKDLPAKAKEFSIENTEKDFVFAGFVVMLDPPHEEVKQAIRSAFEAHLKVVIITGDNAITATAIANKIGLTRADGTLPEVLNGEDLIQLTDDQIWEKLQPRAVIFSRVSPDDKLRIVQIFRDHGEVVAVTGDGVNDTLSLKKADIGVSMGAKGAEVAKEASDMILLDDNFSTIVVAIREGRTIYKNLQKTIISTITSNIGELSCVIWGFVTGFLFGVPIPILAVQILAVDLVGEMLPLTLLTFDPAEKEVMQAKPRNPGEHIVTLQRFRSIAFFGFLMGTVGFLSFLAVYYLHSHETLHYERALTATYLGIILCQFLNILSRRTTQSIFTSYFFSNKNLLLGYLFSLGFVLCIVYVPFINFFLQTAPLSFNEWLYPIGGAILFLIFHELRKKLFQPDF